MSAVCPSCGVAVVPGYVRCPKCHKALPARRQATRIEGGTALGTSRSKGPLLAIIGAGVIGIAVIVYVGTRSSSAAKPAPAAEPTATEPEQAASTVDNGPVGGADLDTPTGPTGPDPTTIAESLERSLKRERLWSTVSVVGARVDVRSEYCTDPKLTSLLDGSMRSFKAAGLTKLRCLAQSGQVVSDREL